MSATDELVGQLQSRTATDALADYAEEKKRKTLKQEPGFSLDKRGIGYTFRDGSKVTVRGSLGGNKSIGVEYRKEF